MRKALPFLIVAILLVPAFLPDSSGEEPQAEWTIMIYMGGGYGKNIESAMPYDLKEIERAGYREGFNIIVLKDGVGKGDSECLVLKPDGLESTPLSEINPSWTDEVEMSSPQSLVSFVDWSLNTYPAKRSMLVLWGHGKGWMGMPDDENGGIMDMSELSLALDKIEREHGRLDVIGFDQCNMAMFEVFYQISPYADYAVASEKEEDMAGWPYDIWLSDIYGMENPDGENVSMQVVKDYVSWASNNSGYSATMSAIDLSRMEGVASALHNYTDALNRFLPYYKMNITVARALAESYDREPFPYDMLNLTGELSSRIDFPSLSLAYRNLKDEVESAVLLERHNTVESDMSVEGATGMSIWFPTYGSTEDYRDLRPASTGWSGFLDAYFHSVPPEDRAPVSMNITMHDTDKNGAYEAFSALASGNGTIHVDVYSEDGIVRSGQGIRECRVDFQGQPGFYTVVAYIIDNGSIAAHLSEDACLEHIIVVSGYLVDAFGEPAKGTIEISTDKTNMSSEANGAYSIALKAPYDYMPGEKASLKVCGSSSCSEKEIWLNGSSVRMDFRVSTSAPWRSYAAALLIFGIGAGGYLLLFDPGRKDRNMKKFKKPVRLKRIKKVMWVKDITDRQKELAELKSALESAKEGRGNTIFLTGEEGVGKRTLMEKLRRDTGVKSVFYECKGSSEGVPYEDIRKIINILKDLGVSSAEPSSIFSQKSKELIFESAYEVLKESSLKEPLVISVFNAHWMGDSSMEVLEYVARGIDDTRVMLVVSAPQEELEDIDGKPHPLNAMLMNLIIEGKVRMIKLERFDRENTRKMLETILMTEIPEESLDKIYDVTQGLPEMISEVAILIRRAGLDINDADSLDLEMPSTVKGLVARRLSRLEDDEVRKVAEWGAILGNSFKYEDVRTLSGVEGADARIYELIEDSILTEEGGIYSFEHPEIRNKILEELGDKAKNMHLSAGNMLEKRNASVYVLAYQFCSAGEREKCLKYSLEAAKEAEKAYAPKKAIKHYLDALACSDEESSYEIYIRLSDNLYMTLEYDRSIDVAKKVIYSEAPENLKEKAKSIMGKCYLEKSSWDEAREIYEQLIKSEDKRMVVEGARGLGKIYWRLGEHKKAAEMIEKAIDIADSLGDELLSGSSRVDLANIYSDIGRYSDAISLYMEAIEILEKSGELREIARAYNNMGEAYRYSGDLRSAVDAYLKCVEFADRSGDINIKGYGLSNIGTVYAHMGRLEDAKEYLEKAYRIFRKKGSSFILSGIAMAYGIVYTKEKNWEFAEKKFIESIEALEEIDVKYDLAVSYLEYARMLKAKGDERAHDTYLKAKELFEQVGSEEYLRRIDEEMGGGT